METNKLKRIVLFWLDVLIETAILCTLLFGVVGFIFVIGLDVKVKAHKNYESASSIITEYSDNLVANNLVINSIEKIPDNHLDMIVNSEYRVAISRDKIKKYNEENNKNVAGYVHHIEKMAYLNPDNYYIVADTLHELGHVIGKLNKDPHNKEEFKKIVEQEKDKMREYSSTNTCEYFADLYMIQFKSVHKMKNTKVPLSTQFITSLTWW